MNKSVVIIFTLIIIVVILAGGFYWALTGLQSNRQSLSGTPTPKPTSAYKPTPSPTSPQSTLPPIVTPTPAPTLTPTPTPEIKPAILTTSSYFSNIGYYTIVGEVKNYLNVNVQYVKIVATFYDSQDTVIGTDFTYTELDTLKPGQKSPFELSSYPDKINPARFKLSVDYRETGVQPFEGLTILSHTASFDSIGYHKIVGEVQNNGFRQSTYVKLICTYYDSAGVVIGMDYTFTDPTDINKGDTAPFELSSYPNKINPANYELQVEGQ